MIIIFFLRWIEDIFHVLRWERKNCVLFPHIGLDSQIPITWPQDVKNILMLQPFQINSASLILVVNLPTTDENNIAM
jgi:hypothetical protein